MSNTICVFCQHEFAGKKSDEHIFPQWLLKYLDIESQKIEPTHMPPDGEAISKRKHPMKSLVAGRVCEECNNGWMSRLETEVQPILIPLIEGEREVTDLGANERFILARWTAKTVYALNSASNYRKIVPPEHFQELYENNNRLPEGVFVFAQQHHNTEKFWWMQGAVWRIESGAQKLGQNEWDIINEKSYKTCLQIGKLLLLVAYWPFDGWIPVLWMGVHLPLWPKRGPMAAYNKDDFPWYDSTEATGIFLASLMIGKYENVQTKQEPTKKTIGRNEPCPCGSGLKYKKCCAE